MVRVTFIALLFAIATFHSIDKVSAQSSSRNVYIIWSIKCPGNWRMEYRHSDRAEIEYQIREIRRDNPDRTVAVTVGPHSNPPRPANPCGSGSNNTNNGNGNSNNGGNSNGTPWPSGGRTCVGHISNQYFMIVCRDGTRYGAYCSRSFAEQIMRQYARFLQSKGGAVIASFTVSWDSCGPHYYRCQNGFVIRVPNYASSSPWATR